MEWDAEARNRFISAASVASVASVAIMHPIAFSIAAMLGLLVSDPDGMVKAKDEWKTTTAGGKTGELEELRTSITTLIERLEKDAKWEGPTAETAKGVMRQFLKELDSAAEQRNGIGDALGSAAKLYNVLSYVAVAIAALMTAYAAALTASTAFPPLRLATQAAVTPALVQTGITVKGLVTTLTQVTITLGLLYTGTSQLTSQQATKFMELKAMPNFGGTGLGNDPYSKSPMMKPIMDPSLTGKNGMPPIPGAPA
jgi:hypothetical protein